MLDRVFDQRLQDQVGHASVERLRIDLHLDGQAISKACLLDQQITFEHLQLLLERYFLHADVLQREPQQVAQARDQAVGLLDIPVHERRDGMQSVEQEMRVKLHLEHLQLRLRQPRFQLRCQQLSLAILAIVVESMLDAEDHPVGQKAQMELDDEKVLELQQVGLRLDGQSDEAADGDVDQQ